MSEGGRSRGSGGSMSSGSSSSLGSDFFRAVSPKELSDVSSDSDSSSASSDQYDDPIFLSSTDQSHLQLTGVTAYLLEKQKQISENSCDTVLEASAYTSTRSDGDLPKLLQSDMLKGIVNKVMSQVLQAFSDNTPASGTQHNASLNSAGTGKQCANSEGGSSGGSGGSMSSGSSSSSGSDFLRAVSPKELSDVSSDGETRRKELENQDDEPVGFGRRFREVIVYVEEAGHLVERARINMIECHGYYTFALELRGEHDDQYSTAVLAHVSAPWAPEYSWAEYYAQDQQGGVRVLLNPLKLEWAEFSEKVEYVIMRRLGPETNGLSLALMRDNNIAVWELTIPSFLVQSCTSFRKIVHIFACAYEGRDPNVWDMK
ncbi:hypothetical protein RND81_14G116300 [Saponaria officinalis]|uniref:Uncharacterized protein n=1 Tax=Saponaria officinalis TaxID=3572 RepID=A0AAW1GLB2_SAPOF